jgi:predicted transcriptional regulator
MLFSAKFWPGLADGSITVAFRRQKRPTVKVGGTLRSPGGVLFIDAVDAIDESDITDDDVRAAGHTDRAEILTLLKPEGTLYRIRFHLHGDDPRVALREVAELSAEDVDALRMKLARLDWALPVLRLIGANPGVVSTDLAPHVGMERLPFKQKVRRLKELGLTESLETGYRLSPRGEAFLRRMSQIDV